MVKKDRLDIAVLIDWVTTPFHASILTGVTQAAARLSCNVYIMVCGRFNSTLDPDSCRNSLFAMAKADFFDGVLVCASSIQNNSDPRGFGKFLKTLTEKPLLTLYETYESIPSVVIDNKAGMDRLMDHVFMDESIVDLGFVKGIKGNRDADDRLSQFESICRSKTGISVSYFEGDFTIDSGRAAFKYFMTGVSPKPQMIICANDTMALGVLEEAHKSNVSIGVCGFDNIENAEVHGLTTLTNPIDQIASLGLETLVEMIYQRPYQERRSIEPELRVRSSSLRNVSTLTPTGSFKASMSEFDLEEFYYTSEDMFARIGLDDNLASAASHFPKLGIDTALVAQYEEEQARVLTAFGPDFMYKTNGDGRFSPQQILPPSITAFPRQKSFMIQALFRGKDLLGHVVFGIQTHKWRVYEMLRKELAMVIQAQKLIDNVRNYAQTLESKVDERTRELKATNAQLRAEIIERKNIEAELKRREEHFRDMAEFLPTAVFELDEDYLLRFANQAGVQMLKLGGAKYDEGLSFLKYLAPEDHDEVFDILDQIRSKKSSETLEFRVLIEGGGTEHLVCEASPLIGHGMAKGIRLSAMNIKHLFNSMLKPEDLFFEHYSLSKRKKEVLTFLIKGYATKEIATELGVSISTAKVHIHKLYKEVKVKNRMELFDLLKQYQAHQFGQKSYVMSLFTDFIKS